MKRLRESILRALPEPLRKVLSACKNWNRTRFADFFLFPCWLAWQCLKHRKRAVILFRICALGDVICTLPLCPEIRRRHPGRLLVFATIIDYKPLVLLSWSPDAVYGARSWKWLPHTLFGLVETVYAPRTADEREPDAGVRRHLIDDLAGSCGFTHSAVQPRLYPDQNLLLAAQSDYGIRDAVARGGRIVGISCGRTWPVRMWECSKWQQLVDLLHAEYEDLTILQFGFTHGPKQFDEFDHLTGVVSVTNRLKSDELAALVASCGLLVSIDSGPVHIAGAVGTPVVGLFGAVSPAFRLPPESPAVGVAADVPCLSCHHNTPRGHWKDGCPHDIRCMKELGVEQVFAAVRRALADWASPKKPATPR